MGWYEEHYGMSEAEFDAETLSIVEQDYGPCPPRTEWEPLLAIVASSDWSDYAVDWRDY